MKMKIILILILFFILIIISYKVMDKEEINYTVLGDKNLFSNNIISKNFIDLIYEKLSDSDNLGFYSKDLIKDDSRIVDFINIIENNDKIDNVNVQNILNRTNLLVLSVGNNEIYYKLSNIQTNEISEKEIYKYLDETFKDYRKLIEKIKKYNNGNIILLGYYNNTNNKKNNKYYKYINSNIEIYCNKNDLYYINTYNILNKNNDYISDNYITNEGNLALFNKIYSKINNLYLHKQ